MFDKVFEQFYRKYKYYYISSVCSCTIDFVTYLDWLAKIIKVIIIVLLTLFCTVLHWWKCWQFVYCICIVYVYVLYTIRDSNFTRAALNKILAIFSQSQNPLLHVYINVSWRMKQEIVHFIDDSVIRMALKFIRFRLLCSELVRHLWNFQDRKSKCGSSLWIVPTI